MDTSQERKRKSHMSADEGVGTTQVHMRRRVVSFPDLQAPLMHLWSGTGLVERAALHREGQESPLVVWDRTGGEGSPAQGGAGGLVERAALHREGLESPLK